MRELTALQSYFDELLLIPGMEMPPFQGHANAFNLREPVDFRVSSTDVPDWNTLLAEAKNKGALVSINHPRVPTGEACMGCGWSPLSVPAKQSVTFTARIEQMTGGSVEIVRDGKTTRRTAIPAAKHSWTSEETFDGKRHRIRIDVRDADGKLALLGNPIYMN